MGSIRWIDVTTAIDAATPVWPGDPAPVLSLLAAHAYGDDYQLSEAFFSLHTGTHIDAPLHFIPGGKDITLVSADKMLGEVRVLDASVCETITAAWLMNQDVQQGERLIFKTFGKGFKPPADYRQHFNALDESAAVYLSGKKIQFAGIDGLSIAIHEQLREVHVTLLQDEIIIVENLNLQGVEEGIYEMICLPLKIQGAEAAPARVMLKQK